MITLVWILLAADSVVAPPVKPATTIEEDSLRQLLTVRRIYVDRLTGGETAAQMRDLLVSSLENTKLFILTDKEERADAFLRGGAEDLVFNDVHTSSEGLNARANAGRGARSVNGANAGIGVGENESSHSEE